MQVFPKMSRNTFYKTPLKQLIQFYSTSIGYNKCCMIVIDKCFQPQQSPTYGIQPGDTVMAKYWEDGLVSKCRSMSFIEREREFSFANVLLDILFV